MGTELTAGQFPILQNVSFPEEQRIRAADSFFGDNKGEWLLTICQEILRMTLINVPRTLQN